MSAAFFYILSLLIVAAVSQPEGWKMTDRFYGFRYRLVGSPEVVAKIVGFADDLGCFGWIQSINGGAYVGEARCSKVNGEYFEQAVRALHDGPQSQFAIKVCLSSS